VPESIALKEAVHASAGAVMAANEIEMMNTAVHLFMAEREAIDS